MRSDRAGHVAELVAAVLAALGIAGGCTKGICSRSSECAVGYICTPYGTCQIPPDASTDGGYTPVVPGEPDAAVVVPDAPDEPEIPDPDDGEL